MPEIAPEQNVCSLEPVFLNDSGFPCYGFLHVSLTAPPPLGTFLKTRMPCAKLFEHLKPCVSVALTVLFLLPPVRFQGLYADNRAIAKMACGCPSQGTLVQRVCWREEPRPRRRLTRLTEPQAFTTARSFGNHFREIT